MSKFIRLKSYRNETRLFNIDNIIMITPYTDSNDNIYTEIMMINDEDFLVKEPFETVYQILMQNEVEII